LKKGKESKSKKRVGATVRHHHATEKKRKKVGNKRFNQIKKINQLVLIEELVLSHD
jgi:hypothetical protein